MNQKENERDEKTWRRETHGDRPRCRTQQGGSLFLGPGQWNSVVHKPRTFWVFDGPQECQRRGRFSFLGLKTFPHRCVQAGLGRFRRIALVVRRHSLECAWPKRGHRRDRSRAPTSRFHQSLISPWPIMEIPSPTKHSLPEYIAPGLE